MQRRELKHIKALSQAVLQQRTDIELFLLSSLETVSSCMQQHACTTCIVCTQMYTP
jgi:hypothetical protein